MLITLDHVHHGRSSILFLLEQTLNLDMNLPSLNSKLLPKLPSVDLEDASSTFMLFHTALLLTKELASQQMECGYGPRLVEFTCPAMFPTILKWLA